MSVAKHISLMKVRKEMEALLEYANKCGWLISDIDEPNQTFTVTMKSPLDNEVYILEVCFSDYPELPPILEFIDPTTGAKGARNAYPSGTDSFFHKRQPPFICNPCSRKAYREFHPQGVHGNWKMIGWQENPEAGTLINFDGILKAIYSRISNEKKYECRRMA